ncbi:ABC transporter substrate-binding protein [Peptacetobacter sp.]|uniref:ABC transporter substrate-binding protein n=1 Tax=Peptacetobacter sp. TaxID=2991975 RepID=UPI002E78D6DF|nr:ABC transporter substrate-binding protein [Peptacetobacter sp.]MEE0451218.1 ABC transporter substrate-binding protein [Peptacetobacter sp.]
MKLNKKLLSLVLSLTLGVTLLTGCSGSSESSGSTDEVKKVGITQLVEHPALDQAKEGFVEGLKENGFVEGENLEIDFQNAQNDNPTSQTIASNFVNDKKDLIFAISTPSAQAALNATQDIPIVFTAVTDAVEAGLVKSNESSENNVTGTSDAIPVAKALELIKKFVPDVKTIGVVCNTSEINSKLQVDALREAAEKEGIKVVDKGATQANEVNQAVAAVAKEADVIFAPTDNLVASSMPIITKVATENKIPVIGSEEGHVENGALACNGISYKELGKKAGEMAAQILKGEKQPSEIPVTTLDETETIINKSTMETLGIKDPQIENATFK